MSKLITLEEYRTLMDLSDEGSALPQVDATIAAASRVMEQHCKREFIRSNTSELFKGNGSHKYYATHCRILAEDETEEIDAPTLYYYAGTASGTNWLESERSWEFDTDKGFIWFTDPGEAFYLSDHRVNWRLDYSYGWTLPNIPSDLKYICARITHLILEQAQHDGMTSQSFGGGSTAYALDALPDSLLRMLNGYRSPRCFECPLGG